MTTLRPAATGTTLDMTLRLGPPGRGGYRQLRASPGERHVVRRDLGGAAPSRIEPLACLVQLSDLHVTDAQSPARAEFLDRLGDDDWPGAAAVGLAALVLRYPNVVCWLSGHTHRNAVRPVRDIGNAAGPGFWEVTTASAIDWPQQARVVEIGVDAGSGDVVVATTMLDHLGDLDPRRGDLDEPATLAGWSRELAANAWQGRIAGEPAGRGRSGDRNTLLVLPAPFRLLR